MPRISKSFKILNFLAPQSRDRITRVVETEMHLFLEKCIITLSPVRTYKAGCHCAHQVPSLLTPAFNLPAFHSLLAAPHQLPLQHD
jgi:hypothetical protein